MSVPLLYEVKMIIAGGRDFEDFEVCRKEITRVINILHSEKPFDKDKLCIIGGRARGADALGEYYANKNDIYFKPFPANWGKYGKGAGPMRNREMADFSLVDCDRSVLIAFWDGKSRGTKDMIDTATKLGIRVFVVKY